MGGSTLRIGERLKQERLRLGFNQFDYAAIGGVSKKTQIDYEKGVTSPDANYLAAIATLGADVMFIIVGAPGIESVTRNSETSFLNEAYEIAKGLPDYAQEEILQMIKEKQRAVSRERALWDQLGRIKLLLDYKDS